MGGAAGESGAATADAAIAPEIVAAVRLAYGLERAYWDDPGAFPTWERLYAHYRQGFSESIAKDMTDYSLSGDGDLATWVPERVEVASIDGPTALAWFETPAEFGTDGAWGFERYMVVRLRLNDDGRWVVYWATDSAEPP